MLGKPWTDADKDFLIKSYAEESIEYISDYLGRSKNAVMAKARELDLKKIVKKNTWTEQEISYLVKMYPKQSAKYIAKKLGRGVDAVFRMAHKMNLTKKRGRKAKPRWTQDEIFYLTNLYATKDIKKIAERLGRTESAVIHKASQLHLFREKNYNRNGVPWADSEFDYLRKHYATKNTVTLSIEMDRPISTIQEYAARMGIHKKRAAAPKPLRKISHGGIGKWTDWESQYLRETYDIFHWKHMRYDALCRSPKSINKRLKTMGLYELRVRRVRSYTVVFYYRTEEELRQKWEYVNFWKEVTNDAYPGSRKDGYRFRGSIAAVERGCK
ncbi:MAG: hypothetical protein K0R00_227 [Herbinix sp.]|nr:hypothetical protein [Herbinix sp.]